MSDRLIHSFTFSIEQPSVSNLSLNPSGSRMGLAMKDESVESR